MNKKKNAITFAAFLILMVGLGANDAMRGIFSTIFSAHFQLSTAQLSQIVTVSYIGNLVFLAVGGFGVDILGRRKAMKMLARDEFQLIGSDSHNLDERKPNWNLVPQEAMAAAGDFARELLGL